MIKVELDSLAKGDRRRYFRVSPNIEEPVVLRSAKGNFPLFDISGSGCCLASAAGVLIEDGGELELRLPGCSRRLLVALRIVRVEDRYLGAEFVDLAGDARQLILQYVRAREIEIARHLSVAQSYNC